jgi:3-oxoacyl-[acyl-carrier protein] reductase
LFAVSEPDEIVDTIQYLMENDFVNGRNVEIDGGIRVQGLLDKP